MGAGFAGVLYRYVNELEHDGVEDETKGKEIMEILKNICLKYSLFSQH
jgi:hypothetical protein